MTLADKHCVPCKGGIPPLEPSDAENYLTNVPEWSLLENATRIQRTFRFPNFINALDFVNQVGHVAETEGHHPDISFGWGYATILFYTHKIKGLHENDFIMAAKVDELFKTAKYSA